MRLSSGLDRGAVAQPRGDLRGHLGVALAPLDLPAAPEVVGDPGEQVHGVAVAPTPVSGLDSKKPAAVA